MERFFTKEKLSKSDLSKLRLIGDGKDDEVYQLSHDKCVKYFFKEETHQRELEALTIGQSSSVIPKLYEHGSNYIVMEFIKGVSLARYLKRGNPLTEELAEKILSMLEELKKVGFKRWDAEVRHILINEDEQLKVIDHKRAFTSDSPNPTKLLRGLKKLGKDKEFLNLVKKIRPDVYPAWKKHQYT